MRVISALLLALFIINCSTSVDVEYSRARAAQKAEKYQEALNIYDRIVKLSGKNELGVSSAREAAQISDEVLKDYPKAMKYYKHLVLYSPEESERISAQQKLAKIYFFHLNDYKQAIIENSRLLEMPHAENEETSYRLEIARAYFYLNEFYQSETEIDGLLKKQTNPDVRYHALLLKGNILMAQKKHDKAVILFQQIIQEYPELANKENLPLNLAVVYEEKEEFAKAIEVLKGFKSFYSTPEYIDIRIKRLQKRLENRPGAKGYKK